MNKGLIFVFLDTSYHCKQSDDGLFSSPLGRMIRLVKKWLELSDKQPAYISRLRLFYGRQLVLLEEGNAVEQFEAFLEQPGENCILADPVSFWQASLKAESGKNPSLFVMSAFIDEKTLSTFFEYQTEIMFMDFGSVQCPIANSDLYKNYSFIESDEIDSSAKMIHEGFLDQYLTQVNFGLSFNADFFTVNSMNDYQMDIKEISMRAMSTSVPVEGFPVLSRSFLMPVDDCYDSNKDDDVKINNEVAYVLIKQLLGDESDKVSDDPSLLDSSLHKVEEAIEQNQPSGTVPLESSAEKPAEGVEEGTSKKDQDQSVKEEVKIEIKEEPVEEEPVKEEKVKELEDDEEFTPVKRRGGKRAAKSAKTPAKRQKTVATPQETPKRATRSSTRIRNIEEAKVKEETIVEEEPKAVEAEEPETSAPVESANTETTEKSKTTETTETAKTAEPTPTEAVEATATTESTGTAEPAAKEEQATSSDAPPQEPAEEELPDPVFLVARVVERDSNIARPAIIRLRGLYEDDKTYYTEEELAERAAKKAAEEAEKAEKTSVTSTGVKLPGLGNTVDDDYSPASPDEGPASPDMAPVISQSIRMIPTEAAPAQDVDFRFFNPARNFTSNAPTEVDDLAGPASPSSPTPQDVDYRTTQTIKAIPLEPVQEKPITEATNKVAEKVEPMQTDGDNTSSTNVEGTSEEPAKEEPMDESNGNSIADVIDEIEEPSMEDLIISDETTIKCIPIESEHEQEERKLKEEAAKIPPNEQEKYLEVIVLDTTWEKFKKQVALIDDEAAAEIIAEREKQIVGAEPCHLDFDKLPGWYSSEAMQFYANKLCRGIRKLTATSSLIFEKEISNIIRIVQYSQSKEYATLFANLIRDESFEQGHGHELMAVTRETAEYVSQLGAFVEHGSEKTVA